VSANSTVSRRTNQKSSQRINRVFDSAELIVERSEKLLAKSKPAAISLFLFIHLIIDLIIVIAVLLHKSG
jgi:hypothetical protein